VLGSGLKETGYPKITISHELTYRDLNSDWKWLHIAATIKNVSSRLVTIDEGDVIVL
jgi:hypothetical protein